MKIKLNRALYDSSWTKEERKKLFEAARREGLLRNAWRALPIKQKIPKLATP